MPAVLFALNRSRRNLVMESGQQGSAIATGSSVRVRGGKKGYGRVMGEVEWRERKLGERKRRSKRWEEERRVREKRVVRGRGQ